MKRNAGVFLVVLSVLGTVHAHDSMQDPMTFTVDPRPGLNNEAEHPIIYADGMITADTDALFRRLFQSGALKQDSILYFNSAGGDLTTALALGRDLRSTLINTAVGVQGSVDAQGHHLASPGAICASACTYAYLGGRFRFVPSSSDRFGLHQFFAANPDAHAGVGEAQAMAAKVVKYLKDMGVDQSLFIAASRTPSTNVLWVSPSTLLKYHFANNGYEPMEAKLQLAGGGTALTINQMYLGDQRTVLVNCSGDGEMAEVSGFFRASPESHWQRITQMPTRSLLVNGVKVPLRLAKLSTSKADEIRPEDGGAPWHEIMVDTFMYLPELTRVAEASSLGYSVGAPNSGEHYGFTMVLAPDVQQTLQDYFHNCIKAYAKSKK